MLQKVLIANRGEIAVRVIRACHELGLRTVAIFSEADRHAMHVYYADEAYSVGQSQARDSYLNIEKILNVARVAEVDAVHPGYGFLAENSKFSKICEEHDIKFIGASPDMIDKMGDKASARATMQAAGVPCIPGSDGLLKDFAECKKVAKDMGYPVMLKATAGGGGGQLPAAGGGTAAAMRGVGAAVRVALVTRMAVGALSVSFGVCAKEIIQTTASAV